MIMTLIRHADKSNAPFDDPRLSAKGYEQAQNFAHYWESQVLPAPTICLYSDLTRTLETLHPLILKYKPQTFKSDLLNPKDQNESRVAFQKRVHDFMLSIYEMSYPPLKSFAVKPDHFTQFNVQICTHYDWIYEAMTIINDHSVQETTTTTNSPRFQSRKLENSWAPLQFMQFELSSHFEFKLKLSSQIF